MNSDSDSNSDDDEAFREYVKQRKQALINSLSAPAEHSATQHNAVQRSASLARPSPAVCPCCLVLCWLCGRGVSPVFGVYRRIESRSSFAELVSSVHEHVWVVAHLYSNSVELCARLHFSLDALAASFDHVLFVRVRADDVMAGFAESGLPAFMLYRGGKCVANALRLGDVLPAHFTDADVAQLLQSKKVLQLPSGDEWEKQLETRRDKQSAKEAGGRFTISKAAGSDNESCDEQ